MKRSDIYSLILIAGIGTLAAFLICNQLLGDPSTAKVEFKKLSSVIESDLIAPDPEVYNSAAVNPTVEVYVGDCVDVDQNGILDEGELIACGKMDDPDKKDEEEEGEDIDIDEYDDEEDNNDAGDAIDEGE